VSEIGAYREGLLSRLRQATADVAWALERLPAELQQYKPSEADWSIHEHAAHLRDMEQEVYLPLLRWATVPEMLDPRDYSRRDWHEHRYSANEHLGTIVVDITRMRDEALLVLGAMDDAAWTAWREDTRWGPVTCQWIAELMYRHTLDHLQGVMALRQDINLEATRPPERREPAHPLTRRS
jgi:hypothetical protein